MIPDPNKLQFTHQVLDPADADLPALMVGIFAGPQKAEGVLAQIAGLTGAPVQELIDSGEIKGRFREFTTIHLGEGSPFRSVLVMGMGDREDFDEDVIRSITGRAVRILRKIGRPRMAVVPSDFPGDTATVVQAVTEGTVLGLYKFASYHSPQAAPSRRPFDEVVFLHPDQASAERAAEASRLGEILGWATNRARDLGNEPANYCTPSFLAREASRIAGERGLSVEIFERERLEEMGMGGILAVGAAGKNPPLLISMAYDCGDADAPTLALVGKGITFDSGGVSIKSHQGMHLMKYDMCGAAAVLEAIDAIAELKPPVNVRLLVPSAENLLDSKGYKPGDLISIYGGRYVEIIDTDAEGRLLLADALSYAVNELRPDLLVDVATLTGGVIKAIGHVGSGIMGNSQWAVDLMMSAGARSAEKMWQFPLWPEFSVHLKSTVAPLANCHGSAVASTPTAGLFLEKFVGDTPWIHLDIAGTAEIDDDTTLYVHKPYLPKRGATGVAVRSLVNFALMLAEACESSSEKLDRLLKARNRKDRWSGNKDCAGRKA